MLAPAAHDLRRGVTIIAARRSPHSGRRLTLKVPVRAAGRRDLVVKRGTRRTTLIGVIRL
jgi:hypothetical protein